MSVLFDAVLIVAHFLVMKGVAIATTHQAESMPCRTHCNPVMDVSVLMPTLWGQLIAGKTLKTAAIAPCQNATAPSPVGAANRFWLKPGHGESHSRFPHPGNTGIHSHCG